MQEAAPMVVRKININRAAWVEAVVDQHMDQAEYECHQGWGLAIKIHLQVKILKEEYMVA